MRQRVLAKELIEGSQVILYCRRFRGEHTAMPEHLETCIKAVLLEQ